MSAIEAASVNVRTMADGTLRITFDVEPNAAGDAFALFGKPGTPAALAALQVGYAAVPNKPKGGPLSKEAALLCKNPAFIEWLNSEMCLDGYANEEIAAEWIRRECSVSSRSDLDSQDGAAAHFINHIRMPFMRAQRGTR